MRILICNERFLFRFGLDRMLLVLAQGLKDGGHEVTLVANRMDRKVASPLADRICEVPAEDGSYVQLDDLTSDWLEANWNRLFIPGAEPDLAIIGGWPFFGAIRVFRDHDVPSVFIDCGAVPLDGLDEGMKRTQLTLRRLRRKHLPVASAAIAISRFILESQTLVDAPELDNAQAILLGADHLGSSLWRVNDLDLRRERGSGPVANVRRLQDQGYKIVLNLGRWEPGGYKRSQVIFDIARELLAREVPQFVVILLEEKREVRIPPELHGVVLPIGFPDDGELVEIMEITDAGISVSTWEGFNLPVAEMQWFGKPVLALDLAAHPEVVCDPWCLAGDDQELMDKLTELVMSGHPHAEGFSRSVEQFRTEFPWSRVQARYTGAFEAIARDKARCPRVVVDVSQACCDSANSGVMRVTRRLGRHLQSYAEVFFAVWDQGLQDYCLPYDQEYDFIGSFNGPVVSALPRSPEGKRVRLTEALAQQAVSPEWILLPEIMKEPRARLARRWARTKGMRVASVFYDSIAVLHPEFVPDTPVRENHADYMKNLAECDLVLAISHFSQRCLEDFWSGEGLDPTTVRAVLLPDEFGGAPRCTEPQKLETGDRVEILCVSTLEPRKNHLALIAAVRRLDELAPGLDWRLTLVGNRYLEADTLALAVRAASHADRRIRWLGVVDDATLHLLYSQCTFTVYASSIEGFGIPIVESLWYGKPVLCHHDGVMRELAVKGGCLMADVKDPHDFSISLARLATDPELYGELSSQAARRPVRLWDGYAREVASILSDHSARSTSASSDGRMPPGRLGDDSPQVKTVPKESHESPFESLRCSDGGLDETLLAEPDRLKDNVLFPGCSTSAWQMADSERLGLMALLLRTSPRTAVEIGAGGSLPLVSQFAQDVYSLGHDATVQEKLSHLENVNFVKGALLEELPALMQRLRDASVPVDLVLIDGDHGAEGVKRDIEIVISHRPIAPLMIVIHDSFNPDCRRGILEATWSDCNYVHWIDVDLVPGRIVEHGGHGDGELWGGLACALLTPTTRKTPLFIEASSQRLFETMVGKGSHAHSDRV